MAKLVKVQRVDVLARLETDLRRLIPADWTWVLTPRAPAPRWSTQGDPVQLATRLDPDAELEFWSPGSAKESLLVQTREAVVPSELTKLLPLYASARWLLASEIVEIREDERFDRYALELWKMRRRKGMTLHAARSALHQPTEYASMMVRMGDADGMCGGLDATYADTARPALQTIGQSGL